MSESKITASLFNTEPVHGGDVYRNSVRLDFSVNLNPFPMPEAVTDAAVRGLAEMHQYPDPVQQKLRESISSLEGIGTDKIICGSGASELLMAVCHAFRPQKALITAPCYAGYERALKASDTQITEYTLDEKKGFALDDGFLDALTDDTDIVFIADPNNPSGKLIEEGLRQKITERCLEKGILLVIDECFLPLTTRGLERNAVNDGALHLRAFTKTFAIPGIRIGYMLSLDTVLLEKISKHLPEWNVSRIAERTGEAAAQVLSETDYLTQSVSLISEERAYLARELRQLGIKVYESDTNYLLLKNWPDLYRRLIEKGIMIRRCANFKGLDDTFCRIAVRRHEDNEQLIRTLKEVL